MSSADGVPLFYRISSIIRSQIHDGEYGPGDRIPTESELVDLYGVSRATIRQALGTLVVEGHLVRKKAKGTFVSGKAPAKKVVELLGDVGDLVVASTLYEVKILDVDEVVPPHRVSEFLETDQEEAVLRIRRARYFEGTPFEVVTNYLPLQYGRLVDIARLESVPLMNVLEGDLKLRVKKGTQLMEAGRATAFACSVLGIPLGDPVLLVTVAVYLADSSPVDLTEFVLRSDTFRYRVDLVRYPHSQSARPSGKLTIGRWDVPRST